MVMVCSSSLYTSFPQHSRLHMPLPYILHGAVALRIAIRRGGLPPVIPALAVGAMGRVARVRPSHIVQRACRCPHARANQGAAPDISRPGTNRCPTAGTNRCSGQRAAACRHQSQNDAACEETQHACCVHVVMLPSMRRSAALPAPGASPSRGTSCPVLCTDIANGMPQAIGTLEDVPYARGWRARGVLLGVRDACRPGAYTCIRHRQALRQGHASAADDSVALARDGRRAMRHEGSLVGLREASSAPVASRRHPDVSEPAGCGARWLPIAPLCTRVTRYALSCSGNRGAPLALRLAEAIPAAMADWR